MDEGDGHLFIQAARGDRDALGMLLEQIAPQLAKKLDGAIGRQWQSVLDVEDVMQVTFMEAFLQIGQLRQHDQRSMVAWVTRIAEHNLHDAIRGLQADKRPQPARRVQAAESPNSWETLLGQIGGTGTTPSRAAERHEIADLVGAAIARLPADYAKVIRLHAQEGHPALEVGRAMGRSRGAVHMLRARAVDRLREELGSASKFFTNPE